MLRTAIITLAAVALLMGLGAWGMTHLADAARPFAPPLTFKSLRIVRGGIELGDVLLYTTRARAHARTMSFNWSSSLRPQVEIGDLQVDAGPMHARFAQVRAHPTNGGWRLEGAGRIDSHHLALRGRVDLVSRSVHLFAASGPLFRGRIQGADIQFDALRVNMQRDAQPSAQVTGVEVRRDGIWWGGGEVAVTRAACGLQPTLSGGHAWYAPSGATSNGATSNGTDSSRRASSSRVRCAIRFADVSLQVATPIGVRHIEVHEGDLQADSIAVRASAPEGNGALVAATDRTWAFIEGSIDLAQLPDIEGLSATGAARGQLALVRVGQITRAHLQGRIDGQIDNAAIATAPVDVSGTTFDVDIQHRSGHLAVEVINLQRGGVHASARVSADARVVEVSVELAPTTCQALWAAIPSALRGPYVDAQLSGHIAPHVHFRLPRANAKKLTLVWKGPSDCIVDALKTRAAHLPPAQVSGPRDDVDWLLRDFRLPVRYATRPVEVGPGTATYVPISQLPRWVGAAAIVSEDSSFNRGRALNLGLLRRALIFNLDRGRYVYGGSTIPQQLAKNLFLTRQKTLARKLQEALVALRMVQVVPTRRILELYLNCIEFAPNVYGIERAARHYFQKGARSLTPKEAAFLGISKPSPRYAASMRRRGSTPQTAHFREYMRRIIDRMRKRGAITRAQAAAARPFRIRWHAGRRISQAENRRSDSKL
ncbi:MAG: hypothetical protein ACI9U2_002307 [Bradymonadia bacterium]|jgi:hypothetical protein